MNKKNKSVVIGLGKICPKCNEPMTRKKHPSTWVPSKSYYFTQWDHCIHCKFIQHYEEFKSSPWKEDEARDDFFKSLRQ